MKHKLLSVFVFLFAASMFSYGQRTVSGVVTSAKDKQPLIGAIVLVEKTTIGTSTDIDGKYSLTIPNDAVNLIVSYTGFKTKTVAITGASMDIAMDENEKQLEDVVVTALGVKRDKKALGYATQQINGSDVNEAKDANVINNLEGKFAGVQITGNGNIGGSSRIVIRGIRSLYGDNQPLFVIDGVVIDNSNITSGNGSGGNLEAGDLGIDYGNAASDINSDDIETINVLKGGAASALYGSRGSDGVIVITTKKGAKHDKGKYKSPIGVTVSESLMFNQVAVLPDYQNQYGAGYGPSFQVDPNSATGQLQLRMQDDGSWGPAIDGRLVRQYNSYDPFDPTYGNSTPYIAHPNNVKDFYQLGYLNNTNVSMDGGNDKGGFRMSFSNMDQKGTVPNSTLEKNTISFSGNYNFTDKLFASIGANYVHDNNTGRPNIGYNSIFSNFTQWFERQLDVNDLKNYINPDGSQRAWNLNPNSSGGYSPYYWNNPYWQTYENYQNDHRDRIFGNAEVGYKLTKWLTAKFRATTDFYNEIREERVATGGATAGGAGVGISQYSIDKISVNENNYEGTLIAQQAFKHDFDLTALLGINRRDNNVLNYYTSTQGGLNLPDWYNLANSSGKLVETDFIGHSRVNSIFGSASVGWKHMLYLDVTLRNDWASVLYSPAYPTSSNVSFFYPSVAASWVFSELVKKSKVLSFGKLRIGAAETGKEPTAYYGTSTQQQAGISFNSGTTNYPIYYVPNTFNNPQLTSELTQSLEVGTELGFFADRIKLDLTYYTTLTKKDILPVEQSGSTGINYRYTNAAELSNQGVELASTFVLVKTKSSFTWSVGFNFAKNYNKVLQLYKDASGNSVSSLTLNQDGFGIMQVEAIPGLAYGQIVTTDYVYDKNGNKIVDLTGNYVKTAQEKPIGSILPEYVGGVSTTLAFKGLSLYVLIDYSKGGKIFSMTNMWGKYDGTLAITAANSIRVNGLVVPGVVEAVDGTGAPILDANGNPTSSGVKNTQNISAYNYYFNGSGAFYGPGTTNVYDATFVKLREIKLMYAIPEKFFAKSPIRGISIGFVGRNLAILKKDVPNIDPESANTSGNLQGIEGGAKPTERSMGFNVQVKF
jgi:TonB-linked SusC/RagA family outer membrane protein